jgi:hypothetical protein
MKLKISLILAALSAGAVLSAQSMPSVNLQAARIHSLSGGVMRFPNGITVHYRIEGRIETLREGKALQHGFGQGDLSDGLIWHHILYADEQYCGYDLMADQEPGTDRIKLTFEPLSVDWPREGSKFPVPQPALPAPQIIAPGDEVVMDLAENSLTGEKIAEHLTVEIGQPTTPDEPHDFTLDEVPLHLVLPTLIADGQEIGQSKWAFAAPIFALQLPDKQWIYLSLKPHDGYDFEKVGVIDSARARFTLGKHNYELQSRAMIVPNTQNTNLYILLDAREPASRGSFWSTPAPNSHVPKPSKRTDRFNGGLENLGGGPMASSNQAKEFDRLDPLNLRGGSVQQMLPNAQETTGDADSAIQASQWRPAPHQELGTVQNGRYRNSLTNVELTVPDGWSFKGDDESSGNGQMARIESDSGITVLVWMKPLLVGAADIPLGLRKAMEDKPSMRPEGWKIRPESVQDRSLSGHLGLSAIADYMQNGRPMVEYDFWVLSGKTHVFFFGQAEEQKLEMLQANIETVAKSALIP